MRMKRTAYRGAIAGVLAAAAMAFWFLAIDASQGSPFRTPAFLEAALLGRDAVVMSVPNILFYTLIHFMSFALVGIGISWILRQIDTAPNVLMGLVVGFLLFDVVFYMSVSVTGVDIVQDLGWPEVLAGNLIAGLTLMGFLHMTGATPPISWWEAIAEHRIVTEGIVSGLIGALVVAIWFFIFDLGAGQPFFTPAALGSALFLGVSDIADVSVSFGTVLGYSSVHMVAFMVTGFLASAVVTEAEEIPPLLLGGILLFVAFEAFFMGFIALLAEFLLGSFAWWTIAVANILATAVMGYYLWRKHPKLRAAFAENPLDKTD